MSIEKDDQLYPKVAISIIYMTAQWFRTDEKFGYTCGSYSNSTLSFYDLCAIYNW